MRIAVWHNLPSGGGKRALYYHVRGLIERGHEVEVWCPPTADRTYLPLKDLAPEHVVPIDWEPKRLRNPVRRAWANYRNVVDKLRAMDEHCRRCATEINRAGFDLLFANADRDILVSSIGRHVSMPSVLYLQEPSRALYEARPVLPWAALPSPSRSSPGYAVRFLHNLIKVQGQRVLVREEHSNAEEFDAILVNSYFSRESVLRAYGLDAKVCYLGVDTELFHAQNKPREQFIVGLGAISPAKGVESVIRAASHVGEVDGAAPRVVWVGNNELSGYMAAMHDLASTLRVDFEAKMMVSDAELVDILNRAAVLAYAPRLEPFGYAPLEANACGLPVVAVAEGGVRETVEHGRNGLVVEHDVRQMGAALRKVLEDGDLAERLGREGRRIVEEKWSLPGSIDRLEQRLAEVLSADPSERASAGAGMWTKPY
jgi:glycosyltransferase involved in cell wall biosynthesis